MSDVSESPQHSLIRSIVVGDHARVLDSIERGADPMEPIKLNELPSDLLELVRSALLNNGDRLPLMDNVSLPRLIPTRSDGLRKFFENFIDARGEDEFNAISDRAAAEYRGRDDDT